VKLLYFKSFTEKTFKNSKIPIDFLIISSLISLSLMGKFRTFCKWSQKDIEKKIDLLAELTDEPSYVCKKCARVSNTKKALCKPAALPALVSWR